MRDAHRLAASTCVRGDVDQASRVVRRDQAAARLCDRVQLPLGQARGHTRPLEAEASAEPAAIGDVRYLDHLVTGQLQQAPGLLLEAELAQGLAGIVVGDPWSVGGHPNELRSR